MVKSISSLAEIVNKQVSSTPQAVAENMERQVRNKSNSVSITVSRPRVDQNDNFMNENVANTSTSQTNTRPQVISWGDHDVNDPLEDFDFDDFDMEYFPSSQGLMSQSNNNNNDNQGVNPNEFFQKAFEEPCSEIDKAELDENNNCDSDFWLDIPQLNTDVKTGPKIGSNLSKAVNAALSVKSNKDCINDLSKQYLRPDNSDLMVIPKVNKESWEAIPR